MHRTLVSLLALIVGCPVLLAAQVHSIRLSPPVQIIGDSSHVRLREFPSAPTVAPSTRGHHARIGAVTGAVVGAVAGIAGSTAVGVGCTRNPCNTRQTRISIAVLLGSVGAVTGGIVGAGIGALLPASSRQP